MQPQPDFSNTQISFASKTDQQLREMNTLFSLFNQKWLVDIGSVVGLRCVQLGLPISWALKPTIFKQFCGGETLQECRTVVEKLSQYNISAIMDYGVEAKEEEAEFDKTVVEICKTIDFTATTPLQKIVSLKVTGFARFSLLEKMNAQKALSNKEEEEWQRVVQRLHKICDYATQQNVVLYIDAEESWIQDPIDLLVENLMQKYNTLSCMIYNTYQMYRHDRLDYLKQSIQHARQYHYYLGAKLVRGAYMEKERKRAQDNSYPSPINADKKSSDTLYNQALKICIENIDKVSVVCATHNEESTLYTLFLMQENKLAHDHPHVHFSQLYGMSDHLTYHLAGEQYNVSKYLPFGPIRDVIPYLIRRAQENSSMSGQMGRELKMIREELTRRKQERQNQSA